jgi:hypothetical protein
MRHRLLLAYFTLLSWSTLQGQAITPSTFQVQAQTATHSGAPFRSVTLSATAEWYAGSQHETGNAQLQASVDGSSTVQLSLGQASRTEAQTASNASKACSWTDQKGTIHNIVGPNCFIAIPWFAPGLFTQSAEQLPALLGTIDNGEVSKDNATFHQVSFYLNRQGVDSVSTKQLIDRTNVKVLYDPQTFLPSSLEYNIHPDNNDLQDIPVKVVYSNYQAISGVMMPFHIEKFVNHSLQLKLDVNNASIE